MSDLEKMEKMRKRMERDIHGALLSFKEGATPAELNRRMDDTLGYTYDGKYAQAGVANLAQLLREHKEIRQLPDGRFKVIPTAENADLIALISKQKDGGKKKKKAAYSIPKGRRSVTAFPSYFPGMRSPLKVSSGRSGSSMSKQSHQRPMTNFARPSSSFARASSSINHYAQTPKAAMKVNASSGPSASSQRPLRPLTACSSTTSASSNLNFISSSQTKVSNENPSVEPVQAARKTSQMPSIKDFAQNSKEMMLAVYPKNVHLSEMTDLYQQHFGLAVDPLQLFSKSWKMLALTTFSEWLEVNDGNVQIKADWAKRNAHRPAPAQPAPAQSALARPAPTQPAHAQPAPVPTSQLPSIQGFRYQPVSKSPTDLIVQKMRSLTVGARQVLPTPERPPGLKQKSNNEVPLADKSKDSASMSAKKPVVVNHQYDANCLRQLQHVVKPPHVQSKIFIALKNLPQVQKTQKGLRKPGGFANFSNEASQNKKNAIPTDSPIPQDSPTSSSTVTISPSSLSPPARQPVRMRASLNSTPTNRLIGRALADVKKQDKIPSPNKTQVKQKPLILPPMSKGALNSSQQRRDGSIHSEASSRASSVARKLLSEAMQSDLPSDQEIW